MKIEYTFNQINKTVERATEIYSNNSYMMRKVGVLIDLAAKIKDINHPRNNLSLAQISYLNSLMECFSDEMLTKAENWKTQWKSDKSLRERGDVISKYYISNGSWFMEIARIVQRSLSKGHDDLIPDFHMFHRMILNEYADKVWKSHESPDRWEVGQLVCCRSNAKIDGWTYQIRAQGINVNKDPCMVIESGSKPISNAANYDEKRGGCRWVSINPIGTTYIFHVMEKDLKIYRQPKKTTKRSKK